MVESQLDKVNKSLQIHDEALYKAICDFPKCRSL